MTLAETQEKNWTMSDRAYLKCHVYDCPGVQHEAAGAALEQQGPWEEHEDDPQSPVAGRTAASDVPSDTVPGIASALRKAAPPAGGLPARTSSRQPGTRPRTRCSMPRREGDGLALPRTKQKKRERIREQINPDRSGLIADWSGADDKFNTTLFPETWPPRGNEVPADLRRRAKMLRGAA